jgi:hypothetical protein
VTTFHSKKPISRHGHPHGGVQYAGAGANLYLNGVLIFTDTAGDLVCVVSDLADGNWSSAGVSAAWENIPWEERVAECEEFERELFECGDSQSECPLARLARVPAGIGRRGPDGAVTTDWSMSLKWMRQSAKHCRG